MISDFTRRICRQLCAERAIELELARLAWKLKILESRGALSPAEAVIDGERKAEAAGLMATAAKGD